MPIFNRLTPKRKFGVELEVIVPSSLRNDMMYYGTVEVLNSAGVEAREEGYGHKPRATWKVTSDGSLSSYGLEIVSPILEGEEGLAEVAKVCTALTSAGFTADRSCGLHVHIDARDFDHQGLFRVVRQFMAEEANFDRMVDELRRNGNQYCASNLGRAGSSVKAAHAKVAHSANYVANQLFRGGRYFKLNVQALWRHHTIEFRQHQGSVLEADVVSWIRLVGLFTDAALLVKNEKFEDMMTKVAPATLSRPQYIEHFALLASRKGRRRVMKGDCRQEPSIRPAPRPRGRARRVTPHPQRSVWNGLDPLPDGTYLQYDMVQGLYYTIPAERAAQQ